MYVVLLKSERLVSITIATTTTTIYLVGHVVTAELLRYDH